MMTMRVVLLAAVAVLVAGPSVGDPTSYADDPGYARAKMPCTPQTLHPGDTLTIVMPMPHGGDLGIMTPTPSPLGGNEYFELFGPFDDAFKAKKTLRVDVSNFKGVNSANQRVTIFTTPGRYEFQLSQVLGTEDPTIDGWCAVDFAPKR